MKSIVRKWPFAIEFALVMAIAFGPLIYSAWQMMPRGKRAQVRFDDAVLLQTIAAEAVMGLGLAVFLKMRGYTRMDFPFQFGWRQWVSGLELLAYTYAATIATAIVGISILGMPAFTAGTMQVSVAVSLPVAVIGSLVNALYEELFVMGYIVRGLEKPHGIETAILFTVFVRFLYHVYQGPQAIFTVIPIGIVFGWYYARHRNLWALVFAHTLIDVAALTLSPR